MKTNAGAIGQEAPRYGVEVWHGATWYASTPLVRAATASIDVGNEALFDSANGINQSIAEK